MNALAKLFEVVAPALGAPADQLEAADGKIRVKGNPAKSLTWKRGLPEAGHEADRRNGRRTRSAARTG